MEYPESEREIHALLSRFAAVRRTRMTAQRGRKAADLVTLLLKKRLFSSPRAFAHTVGVYLETLQARTRPAGDSELVPEWLDGFFDDVATLDDEQLVEAEDDALGRSGRLQAEATDEEIRLLREMEVWAIRHDATPDAKARELIAYLASVCRPDGENWTNERVVVFTEYRDTQMWLADLLAQEGLAGGRIAQLYGGMEPDRREQLRLAFQADPTEHTVRILLATDAAGEGIDLPDCTGRKPPTFKVTSSHSWPQRRIRNHPSTSAVIMQSLVNYCIDHGEWAPSSKVGLLLFRVDLGPYDLAAGFREVPAPFGAEGVHQIQAATVFRQKIHVGHYGWAGARVPDFN